MNMNTPLLFEFFDLSFVFAAHVTTNKAKHKKERKENRLLQVNEHVFTVRLNAIPFFSFGVSVPPHAVCVLLF